MKFHRHDMKPQKTNVHKCSSCAFRCTDAALHKVESATTRHIAVKKNTALAKLVWNG